MVGQDVPDDSDLGPEGEKRPLGSYPCKLFPHGNRYRNGTRMPTTTPKYLRPDTPVVKYLNDRWPIIDIFRESRTNTISIQICRRIRDLRFPWNPHFQYKISNYRITRCQCLAHEQSVTNLWMFIEHRLYGHTSHLQCVHSFTSVSFTYCNSITLSSMCR